MVYISVCVYIYMHVCVCAYIYIYMCVCVCIYIHTDIQIYIYICIAHTGNMEAKTLTKFRNQIIGGEGKRTRSGKCTQRAASISNMAFSLKNNRKYGTMVRLNKAGLYALGTSLICVYIFRMLEMSHSEKEKERRIPFSLSGAHWAGRVFLRCQQNVWRAARPKMQFLWQIHPTGNVRHPIPWRLISRKFPRTA